jgi:AMP nucleosidase
MRHDLLAAFAGHGIRDLEAFEDAGAAVERIGRIYAAGAGRVRAAFEAFTRDEAVDPRRLDAYYPFLGIRVEAVNLTLDARLSYGALLDPGLYGTTLTRPELFADYYRTQIELLLQNHGVPVVVGISDRPIPLPFVVEEATADIRHDRVQALQRLFPLPNLAVTDDSIANGTRQGTGPRPLALFTADRVDYSLQRIGHYTGSDPDRVQRFVLFTNYQRYVEHFVAYAREAIGGGEEYEAFVAPGNVVEPNPRRSDLSASGTPPRHLPQMPAYHLIRPDRRGITMVDIGVGPSNARTITDHLAVIRPHVWLMLGHCAGLRRSQQLGDYVLAHAYVRADRVLDEDLPLFVPVPPIAEVQVALQQAVAHITGLEGYDLKTRMRTGTVVTTDNRNWELRYHELFQRLNQSRAIAVDMESATIAANGFRFRVPYGTLLCVSDKPLHGEIKMRGMASSFYRERIDQHLRIGLEAIRILRDQGTAQLHSRKLRSFDEPAFR